MLFAIKACRIAGFGSGMTPTTVITLHRMTSPHENSRPYRSSRSEDPQSEEHRRGHPSEQGGRDSRSVRIGEVLAGSRNSLRGRLQTLSGVALNVHTPAHDPGIPRGRGRGALRPCGSRAAPASGRAGDQKHLRHIHGAPEQRQAHVLSPGASQVPQRTLSGAEHQLRRHVRDQMP